MRTSFDWTEHACKRLKRTAKNKGPRKCSPWSWQVTCSRSPVCSQIFTACQSDREMWSNRGKGWQFFGGKRLSALKKAKPSSCSPAPFKGFNNCNNNTAWTRPGLMSETSLGRPLLESNDCWWRGSPCHQASRHGPPPSSPQALHGYCRVWGAQQPCKILNGFGNRCVLQARRHTTTKSILLTLTETCQSPNWNGSVPKNAETNLFLGFANAWLRDPSCKTYSSSRGLVRCSMLLVSVVQQILNLA